MRVSGVTIRRRILFIMMLLVFLYVILIGRLGYLQLYRGDWLLAKAEDLWSRDIPFEGKRGRILDRNGNVLAYNVSTPSVLAIPAQIKDKEETARKLSAVLNMDEKKIYEQITRNELHVYLRPGGMKLTQEKAREVESLHLPGIVLSEDSSRYYPYGNLAAHVLGFAGIDNQGLMGLELVYDENLRGKRGAISYYSNAKGGVMPNQPSRYIPPQDGKDLVTSLDVKVQQILEREMEKAWFTYSPESMLGIVVKAKTGETLAMASYPTFDPANYQDYSSEVYNRNLPIWRMYEPGSTFKIITLAAALEEGKVNLTKEHFYDPGYVKVAGVTLHCWKPGGHGDETFLEVVENSCNPGFIELGQRVGKEKLFRYIRNFGFGEKTGIDLRGEAKGILFDLNKMGPVELATTSFGQGVSVTPIQQVMAVAAAVNGGKLLTPYLGKEWIDPKTGEKEEIHQPTEKRTVISPETSKQVREALESVVAKGTGYRAYVDEYRVGGKTGTAQKVGPNGAYLPNNYIVSFIGVAPADDPELVAYVAVDHPQGVQFGGVVAAPIVGRILEDALRYLNIPPRKGGIPKEYRYPDPKLIAVPDLRGMNLNQIRLSYYGMNLEVEGKGEKVISQSPAPGTKITEGEKIRVYLGDNGSSSQ
ncbi:stage V sporulation protein D [Thermicanus aegyptius]|uniref:stage V sporulation protein D n=1 Tax=Thermicanus aegyptius TaxID=94009 RepID=UPI0004247A9F|nr:stage V sporulation protein D [Thermicanus aegyptius]